MSAPFVVLALRLSAGDLFDAEIAAEVFVLFFGRFGGIKTHARRRRRYIKTASIPACRSRLPVWLGLWCNSTPYRFTFIELKLPAMARSVKVRRHY
jgi:hypothetical protein